MPIEIADIEEEIQERQLGHMTTDEIVLFLTGECLEIWRRDLMEIKERLWNEQFNDAMGDAKKKENIELTGEYITAVHLWAKGIK